METVNQDTNATAEAPQTTERTFSQAEVDTIVRERLRRDRADRADYDELKKKAARLDKIEEASKTELQKATDRADKLQKELDEIKNAQALREIREKVAADTGVPINLLTGTTEDECTTQAQEILRFAKPQTYPAVPDRGEANFIPKQTARDSFADWFNKIT